jgi:hypothetical protein
LYGQLLGELLAEFKAGIPDGIFEAIYLAIKAAPALGGEAVETIVAVDESGRRQPLEERIERTRSND